jgi:hypothetical protein
MTPDFLTDLNSHVRPYPGNAYGIFSQQHTQVEPETYFYVQAKDPERSWSPLSETFDDSALPIVTKWVDSMILPDGWEVRIVKVEVSVAEPDREPVEEKTPELVSTANSPE